MVAATSLLAGPGARGDPTGLASWDTRWVCGPAGATGPIGGRRVALGLGQQRTRCDVRHRQKGYSIQFVSDCPQGMIRRVTGVGGRHQQAIGCRYERVLGFDSIVPPRPTGRPKGLKGSEPRSQSGGRSYIVIGSSRIQCCGSRHVSDAPRVKAIPRRRTVGGKGVVGGKVKGRLGTHVARRGWLEREPPPGVTISKRIVQLMGSGIGA
ncbi:hypothetical protein TIFTF001_036443 [Ficus carica]|uniref:Uncharacterized protein n=1 Tax=Ficus carica TaxID=3494 RepID=A0AA88E3T0_FICCA|nr:hypothetical protein TIFTF001_036443 [Ficus carica]